jgi:hypothetical protein
MVFRCKRSRLETHIDDGKRFVLRREESELHLLNWNLQNFRVEFAVTYAGTDCHFSVDFCRCAYDLAAFVHRDAVAAAQRCVGS